MAKHDFVWIDNKVAIQIDENTFIVPKVTEDGKFISVVEKINKE